MNQTVSGMLWAALAALSYATMNVLLRTAALSADPFFSAWIRVVPVVTISWGLVFVRVARTGSWQLGAPDRALWPYLALVGVILNLTGNGAFQVALAVGGLALTIPVSQGAVLWGGAIASRFILSERVPRSTLVGIALLIAALFALTGQASAAAPDLIAALLAVLAASLAGVSYGTGNTLLRRVVTRGLKPEGALAVSSLTGLVVLGAVTLARIGIDGVLGVPLPVVAVLLLAGVFNFVAFFSLTTALGRISVVRVNAVSGAQTAISALAGIALFAEPLTAALVVGLALTIGGIALINRPRRLPRSPG